MQEVAVIAFNHNRFDAGKLADAAIFVDDIVAGLEFFVAAKGRSVAETRSKTRGDVLPAEDIVFR